MNLNQKEKASALIKNVFLAIVVGPVVGALDAFFGRILIAVSAFRLLICITDITSSVCVV